MNVSIDILFRHNRVRKFSVRGVLFLSTADGYFPFVNTDYVLGGSCHGKQLFLFSFICGLCGEKKRSFFFLFFFNKIYVSCCLCLLNDGKEPKLTVRDVLDETFLDPDNLEEAETLNWVFLFLLGLYVNAMVVWLFNYTLSERRRKKMFMEVFSLPAQQKPIYTYNYFLFFVFFCFLKL